MHLSVNHDCDAVMSVEESIILQSEMSKKKIWYVLEVNIFWFGFIFVFCFFVFFTESLLCKMCVENLRPLSPH